ncbi:hypothetical protein GQ600_26241 [Phytophthora cactorum]|nr:hypothetical protein GQ600_26241 [Phytophthora cactorum]
MPLAALFSVPLGFRVSKRRISTLENLSKSYTPPFSCEISAGMAAAEEDESTSRRYKKRKLNELTTSTGSNSRQGDQDANGVQINAIADLLHLGEEIQRKRRRDIQRRYRTKQAELTTKLVNDVHQLHKDIKKLQQQRDSVGTTTEAERDVWNVALEYYVRFRHRNTQGVRSQLDFLRVTMAPDVASNGGFGPVELAKSWNVLRWFDDVKVDLQSLVKQGEDSIDHENERDDHWTGTAKPVSAPVRALVAKLLEQRIVIGNVPRTAKADSDLLTPMLRLLGRLEDVALAFDQAPLSPEFQWSLTS